MQPLEIVNVAFSLVATLFGVLILLLGWLGNKVYSKLESIESKITRIEFELRGEIQNVDRRVTRLETFVELRDHG